MIISVAHKGLELFWEKNDATGLPSEPAGKIARILHLLDTLKTMDPLRKFKGYRLHQLSGRLEGYWAVAVSACYSITFKFIGEDVYLLDFVDYH